MNKQYYLLNEIATIVGVKAHRISYAIGNGYLPEPTERINNKRLFSPEDLRVAASYFAAQPQRGGRRAKA